MEPPEPPEMRRLGNFGGPFTVVSVHAGYRQFYREYFTRVLELTEEPLMANIPNDPYRPSEAPYRSPFADDARDAARADNDLQPDPELAEGPASGGRVAMITLTVALVLGAVFYGLNRSSIDQASTAPATQNKTAQAQNNAPLTAPPGMRDVTPRAPNAQSPNTDAGVTTGAAPSRPMPPQAGPTETEQSSNPLNQSDSK
jgi:hypothetical protein